VRMAAESGVGVPDDWAVALPRHVDARAILSQTFSKDDFISAAYDLILGRKASAAEIRAHRRNFRWITPSDFLVTLAESAEAAAAGGEIVLDGLGRRSPSVRRFLEQISGRNERYDAGERNAAASFRNDAAFKSLRELIGDIGQRLGSIEARNGEREALMDGVKRACDSVACEQSEIRRELRDMQQVLNAVSNAIDSARTDVTTECQEHMNELVAEHQTRLAGVHAAILEVQPPVLASLAEVRESLQRIEARVRTPAIPGARVTVVEVDGFLMGVPAAEWRAASYYHHRGPMEPGVYAVFKRIIRPGMFVADIGANIGLYTLLAARLLQGSGRVFSFEPTPGIFDILRNNVQLNGHLEAGIVKMHNVAISDSRSRMTFFSNPEDSTHNSLFAESEGMQRLEVDAITLDGLLGPESRLDFVKMDVEGAEPLALRGMQALLRNNPQMVAVMEFAPEHLRRGGHQPAGFLDELSQMGLRASIIEDQTGELQPATPSVVLSRAGTNLFLTR
jgi:FkbM family methyltransferase